MKLTWNNRVMLHKGLIAEEDCYAIHEVHYENNIPIMYTEEPLQIIGDNVEELEESLQNMLRCLKLSVLTKEDFPCKADDL